MGCSTGSLGAQLSAESWFPHLELEHWFQALNSYCSIGGPEGPLCWVLVFPTASYLQLTGYIIVHRPASSCERHKSHSIQPVRCQGYILIFLDWMHPLFTQVHFLFWQFDQVGGQYETARRAKLYKPVQYYHIYQPLRSSRIWHKVNF